MPLLHTQCSFGYNDGHSEMMGGMGNNSVPKLESFHMSVLNILPWEFKGDYLDVMDLWLICFL